VSLLVLRLFLLLDDLIELFLGSCLCTPSVRRNACNVVKSFVELPFECELLQVEAGIILEPSDERLEFSGFSLYSCGGLSVTPTRCLVKYV
jgi:hypothetical protein